MNLQSPKYHQRIAFMKIQITLESPNHLTQPILFQESVDLPMHFTSFVQYFKARIALLAKLKDLVATFL